MAKTYYDILGLRASASSDEIKRAYRKKAMESHPDVNPSPKAAEVFVEINEAYAILSDQSKRQVYNQKLRDQSARAAGNAYVQSTQNARDEAYRQWVQQAKAQAAANANMNYQDFKRSRFVRAEASVFLYLQFVVLGMFFLLGTLMLLAPFAAMFLMNWKVVFAALVLVPVAFRIYEEGWRGLKELRNSL
jgi:DnaJ-class molecular chaperone